MLYFYSFLSVPALVTQQRSDWTQILPAKLCPLDQNLNLSTKILEA